ncbi:MAG: hypothetical protein SGI77_22910 [Pirellulaceae bacterium]|nr:hypothetical protein [Pirellulaceae bacterium]
MDRGLLLALMALQSDFFTRQQFLVAFEKWLVDRSQPLDQLLVSQALLTPSQLERLASKLLAIQSRSRGEWQAVISDNVVVGAVYNDMLMIAKKDAAVLGQVKAIGEAMPKVQNTEAKSENIQRIDSVDTLDMNSTIMSDGELDPYATLTSAEFDELE